MNEFETRVASSRSINGSNRGSVLKYIHSCVRMRNLVWRCNESVSRKERKGMGVLTSRRVSTIQPPVLTEAFQAQARVCRIASEVDIAIRHVKSPYMRLEDGLGLEGDSSSDTAGTVDRLSRGQGGRRDQEEG